MDDEPEWPAEEPVAEPAPDSAGPAPRRRSVPRRVGQVVLALLSVVALVATGYAYLTYHQVQGDLHTTDVLGEPDSPDVQAPPADDGAEDILLVGVDARTDMQGNPLPLSVLKTLRTEQTGAINTDTLIILRVPKNGGKPVAISIPRDTWVTVPKGGQAKINSVFGTTKAAAAAQLRAQGKRDQAEIERDSDQAGRKALVQTIQDFTQVRVDHYAEVNLLGFYLITEALGGVQVCLSHATEDKDSGADFSAGLHTVTGAEALSFVRQRKNLPRGDLDRIVRQQVFLGSALHKVLTAGVLTSPSKMSDLTDALHKSLVLDPDFDLLQFAEKAKGLASGDVTFETIPVITINGRSPDGQSIVEVDPKAVQQYVAGLAGRTGGGGAASGGGFAQASINGVTCVN
ncbi:LCP family protein required for cell wall assembly [Amycolatopsis bartoniae]|uniref:LytTR family transcriptional regulator n=1 Tax=Amycolatopsis bartoniae TaxID=941986 RepID=A0A8H9MEJ4_9PSEU|nr:LCP family protein required for cell wall assembly [Amycolatopsis bartoniae]TVT07945.1 LytR family transcriptional regulator [Amycolatopsis bartoniae]GHF78018.1 LytTR family transcriptional regulator [Amycolatopsis bartoniae]